MPTLLTLCTMGKLESQKKNVLKRCQLGVLFASLVFFSHETRFMSQPANSVLCLKHVTQTETMFLILCNCVTVEQC